MTARPLSWGIVGTGGIATDFAQALGSTDRARVVHVSGTTEEHAKEFAKRFAVERASGSLEPLLADPAVDAVYVATPHTLHEPHSVAALEAGKHVLCEKPMTTSLASAERMVACAERNQRHLMEAFMYRCHPMTAALIELLQGGTLGQLRYVRADFGFRSRRTARNRLFDRELGGGAIFDVGGYPVSFARLLAGLAIGRHFDEPGALAVQGHTGDTGVDVFATAQLSFASGFGAQVSVAIRHQIGTRAVIWADGGRVELEDPWIPGGDRQGLASGFTVYRDGESPERVERIAPAPVYALEVERLTDTLPGLEPTFPALSWRDSLGNLAVLERWRRAIVPD